jgi:hypothetical protein
VDVFNEEVDTSVINNYEEKLDVRHEEHPMEAMGEKEIV